MVQFLSQDDLVSVAHFIADCFTYCHDDGGMPYQPYVVEQMAVSLCPVSSTTCPVLTLVGLPAGPE